MYSSRSSTHSKTSVDSALNLCNSLSRPLVLGCMPLVRGYTFLQRFKFWYTRTVSIQLYQLPGVSVIPFVSLDLSSSTRQVVFYNLGCNSVSRSASLGHLVDSRHLVDSSKLVDSIKLVKLGTSSDFMCPVSSSFYQSVGRELFCLIISPNVRREQFQSG